MPQSALHDDFRHADHSTETYTISDLCEEFEVTARALRFYEDEGLIAPTRHGLSRVYSWRDRARLAWILRGKRVGFSLAEIREMIDLYDLNDGREAQRRDIDATITELAGFVAKIGDPDAILDPIGRKEP